MKNKKFLSGLLSSSSSSSSSSTSSLLSSSDIISIINYSIHICIGYFYIIPKINDPIKRKCNEAWNCRMHLSKTWLGYKIDTADGQWTDLRKNLWLLWLAMICVSILHFYFRLMTINQPKKKKTSSSSSKGRKRRNSKSSLKSSSTDRSVRSGSSRDSSPESSTTRSTQETQSVNQTKEEIELQLSLEAEEEDRLRTAATPPSSYFRCLIGIGFIFLLHGRHSLVVVVIAYLGFQIASWQHDKKSCTMMTWIYALMVLLFKESYRLKHLQ